MLNGCTHSHLVNRPYELWGEENYIDTDTSRASRHIQLLLPDNINSAQGCLLIVHGMNEHSGRYGDIARYFSARFIVAGVDLTAHGLSNQVLRQAHKQAASDKGYYEAGDAYLEQSQLRNLQPMRDDIDHALTFLDQQCQSITKKQLPIFILSHSLGSLVSASYFFNENDKPAHPRVEGIIFSGPAFAVTEVPGWRGWFQNPLIGFTFHIHEHFLSPHNEPLPLLLFNQIIALVTVPILDGLVEFTSLPGLRTLFSQTGPAWVAEHLTDSEEERKRLSEDQYMIRRCILNYVLGIEKEIIQFRKQMVNFDIPYFLIYSEQDPITPAWGNLDFIAATQTKHIHNETMVLGKNAYHEQLFSKSKMRTQILRRIDDWLDKRLVRLLKNPTATDQ